MHSAFFVLLVYSISTSFACQYLFDVFLTFLFQKIPANRADVRSYKYVSETPAGAVRAAEAAYSAMACRQPASCSLLIRTKFLCFLTSEFRPIAFRLVQQFAGAFQQGFRHLAAAGDAGQLRLALLPVQQDHAGIGAAAALALLH